MRRIIVVCVCVLLILPSLSASAQADPFASATWLASQQADNGSFGDEVGATALSLMALATVEEENPAALDWIAAQPFAELSLDALSLSLIALVATGTDVGAFADGELLANYSQQLRDANGGPIDQFCLGLIARFALNIPLSEAQSDALLVAQDEQGGFAISTDVEPDVITTSLCLQALVADEQDSAIASALDFIRNLQRPDGGWTIFPTANTSDPLATAFVMQALIASDQSFSDWDNPERTLIAFADAEGAFLFDAGDDDFFNLISTAVAIPVFQGLSLLNFSPMMQTEAIAPDVASDAPTLNLNWKLVGDGFEIELDTAADFFTTVVDPFTNTELYGIEIINWTAEYPYTGYIVAQYLTADILLWMIQQDPSVLDNISVATLSSISAEELAKLPAELQARVTDAE